MQIYFYIEKNSDLHLEKMQIYFYVEKNPDLHLEKMQILFLCWEKSRRKFVFMLRKIQIYI